MKLTVQQILDGIAAIDSVDDLNRVVRVVNIQQKVLQTLAAGTFSEGDWVRFESVKQGRTVYGTVTAVGPKWVKLKEHARGTEWRVAPTLLTHVEKQPD